MEQDQTALERWSELDNKRSVFLQKCERLAILTIPHVCTPDEYSEKNDTLQYDWQSFGATCTTNLQNKLMLTLFAPSRPFFRIDIEKSVKELIELNGGLDRNGLEEILSQLEKMSVKRLDGMNLRTKLGEVILNLVVLGNCLFEINKDKTRVYNIRKWNCKRDVYGKLYELVIKEKMPYSNLAEDVKELKDVVELNLTEKDTVEFTKWIKRDEKGDYRETQWVNDRRLPKKFDGKYDENKLPYQVLTWTLPDGSDYGVGHVEKVFGLLEQLSILERARVQSAVLASEFRWVVNPNGLTQVEDLEESENGSVISGDPQNISLISSGTTSALPHIDTQINSIKQELARFFLMGSAQIRDAERVTAEEIRLQAQELETSLGGAYTNIANELQAPLAKFLLANIEDNPIKIGKGVDIVIVTGLDALSRNGDVDNMNALIANMAQISNLPPSMLQVMNMEGLFKFYASGYGISTKDVLLPPEQVQANVMAQQEAQMAGAEGPPPGVTPPM